MPCPARRGCAACELCSTCELCTVPWLQLFDAGSRTLLRQFKGHKGPVHVARFAADNLHVLTGGDDGLAAMWDITSGLQACVL